VIAAIVTAAIAIAIAIIAITVVFDITVVDKDGIHRFKYFYEGLGS
jgi:hypothetical protein